MADEKQLVTRKCPGCQKDIKVSGYDSHIRGNCQAHYKCRFCKLPVLRKYRSLHLEHECAKAIQCQLCLVVIRFKTDAENSGLPGHLVNQCPWLKDGKNKIQYLTEGNLCPGCFRPVIGRVPDPEIPCGFCDYVLETINKQKKAKDKLKASRWKNQLDYYLTDGEQLKFITSEEEGRGEPGRRWPTPKRRRK